MSSRAGDACSCRKPRTGLADLAAREHNVDARESYVVGDKVVDIEFGRNLDATTILVQTGYGSRVAAGQFSVPDHLAADFGVAARLNTRLSDRERPTA